MTYEIDFSKAKLLSALLASLGFYLCKSPDITWYHDFNNKIFWLLVFFFSVWSQNSLYYVQCKLFRGSSCSTIIKLKPETHIGFYHPCYPRTPWPLMLSCRLQNEVVHTAVYFADSCKEKWSVMLFHVQSPMLKKRLMCEEKLSNL